MRLSIGMETKPGPQIVLIAGVFMFFSSPLMVFLHELVHIIALELGGIDSHLAGFAMAMPVGFLWDFESLSLAKALYGASPLVFVFGAISAPVFTLLISYSGLFVFRRTENIFVWSIAFSAIALRTIGITANMPKFLDGTIKTSDEAIAAFFMGWPLWSFYLPSIFLGYLCIMLLIFSLPGRLRVYLPVTGVVNSIAGFLVIEYFANKFIFNLDTWIH